MQCMHVSHACEYVVGELQRAAGARGPAECGRGGAAAAAPEATPVPDDCGRAAVAVVGGERVGG